MGASGENEPGARVLTPPSAAYIGSLGDRKHCAGYSTVADVTDGIPSVLFGSVLLSHRWHCTRTALSLPSSSCAWFDSNSIQGQ